MSPDLEIVCECPCQGCLFFSVCYYPLDNNFCLNALTEVLPAHRYVAG